MKNKSLLISLFIIVSCGVQDSSDQKDGIADSDHRIFVTGATYNGALGGIAGADNLCMQAAQSIDLEREYRAILSTSSSDASSRLNITGGVYLFTSSSTRILVAASGIDLWGTSLDPLKNEINRSEQYALINDKVWTGTNSEGGDLPTDTCGDWTTTSATGFYGSSSAVNSDWVEFGPEGCGNFNHLYCISVN